MSEPTAAPGSDTINFLPDAVDYARRGWRVLPVFPGEKRPRLNDWPSKASADPEVVRDMWVTQPDSNIGIATGVESGFFVLDIDPKSGGHESLTALEAQHGGLPRTRTVETGSKGHHYYFEMPDDFVPTNSPGRLKGTGIDVRGEGGQVLAPPSVTAVGGYRLALDAAIAKAPEWLLELIRPKADLRVVDGGAPARIAPADLQRQRGYAVNVALASAARDVEGTTEGGRNQALNDNVLALAGIAAHGADLLTFDEVHDAMEKACRANGLLEEDGRRSFLATMESAWKAGLDRPRTDWPPRDRNADLFFGPVPGQRPTVNISGRKENEGVDEVLGHIADANEQRPTLFAHGTEVVEVIGQPGRTETLDKFMLAYKANERIDFVKTMPNGGQAVANLPDKWRDTIMSLPEKPFPMLNRISYTPFFSPSGRYVDAPEYDDEACTYYAPALGVEVPSIPERPSEAEVEAAKALLLDDLLADFPFVNEADRAHAVALMLLPFVRDMIEGPTPLHNIEAPTPGSGKGLLMKVLLMPGVGGRQVTCGAAADNEEWEKRLVSFLRLSPQALVIDNVNERVTSGFLCTALTEPVITSRLLGVSQQVTIPVRTTWVMTANNPKFSDEVARRTIRIRVDAGVEHPEDRSGFKHADLLGWASAHRGDLIGACCTLAQAWVVAGAPQPVATKPFGSFEAWQAVMSGLLDFVGVPGLLDNKAEFMAVSDDESGAWDHLVDLLLSSIEDQWSAAVIAELVADNGIAIDLPGTNRALMMGRELGRQRDRWHRGKTFTSRTVKGKTMWRLVGRTDGMPDL